MTHSSSACSRNKKNKSVDLHY
uniref:Uncharacterized protein n=1 Tax=Arundo donax TaxID=35708 RepID=A0A0A9GRE3_ARUDO